MSFSTVDLCNDKHATAMACIRNSELIATYVVKITPAEAVLLHCIPNTIWAEHNLSLNHEGRLTYIGGTWTSPGRMPGVKRTVYATADVSGTSPAVMQSGRVHVFSQTSGRRTTDVALTSGFACTVTPVEISDGIETSVTRVRDITGIAWCLTCIRPSDVSATEA